MNKNMMKVVVSVLVVSLTIVACGGQAITETPAAINEPQHEIYAGFTENKALPFIMIHQSGENLVVTQNINSSNITGVVWTSVDGESIVIYSDSDGKPKSVVIGEEVILYSNYTNDTVDLTVIQVDGTRTRFQSKLDTDLLNKITSFVPSSDSLVSYSIPDSIRQKQLDDLFWMKTGMYMLGAATCTVGTYAAITTGTVLIPPVLLTLAKTCSGTILGTLIRVGTILDIDVGGLQSINNGLNMVKCATAEITACVNVFLTEAEKQEKLADKIISNPNYSGLQLGTIPFDSVPTPVISKQQAPPGIYPIGREYSQSVDGWSAVLDYIEVLDDGTLKVSNVWTNNLNQCLYQGDCQVYCSEENDDTGAVMRLFDGTSIAPIETNCTLARGQVWDVPPGETFNDWAIYPPLDDATRSFSIIWYALGSVDNIVLVTSP